MVVSNEQTKSTISYNKEDDDFLAAVTIYGKYKENPDDPKLKKVAPYAEKLIVEGVIRYSEMVNNNDKGSYEARKAQSILNVMMPDIVRFEELKEKIAQKSKTEGVKVALGANTTKLMSRNNDNKERQTSAGTIHSLGRGGIAR